MSAKHRHSFHSGHLTTIDSSRVHAVDDMRTLRAPHILYPLRASQGQKKGCGGGGAGLCHRLVSSVVVKNPGRRH
ncbi:hypothetical protein RM6536_1592 [Rothia mucilaginosa]|uniref:Uncharacterized protein n=1 Tax=Rothia mucilaginosa TaxID=43675 RepID=A0A0K2S178_9MICC|nr:hypothetical protein RM6536_1592 [Rothia mucilaginosa]